MEQICLVVVVTTNSASDTFPVAAGSLQGPAAANTKLSVSPRINHHQLGIAVINTTTYY
jgi:hypothetical protein